MSSSGRSSGGASLAFGTAAGKPGTPATSLYMSTDTGELFITNATNTAWLSLGGSSRNPFFVGSNNFPALAFDSGTTTPKVGLRNFSLISVEAAALNVHTVGNGLQVAEGANAKQGAIAAMTAGTIVVANTSVTANSRILVCRGAGGTNPGAWFVSAQTVATSFAVTSTNAADTGTGVFLILEPAA